jgi:hypothetical protein
MEPALRDLVAGPGGRGMPDPVAVLRDAQSQRLALARDDLRWLLALAGTAEVFAAPTFIIDFMSAYLRARRRRPRVVVDLWAPAGWMLPPLVAALRPARAIGFLPDGGSRELAQLLAPTGGIEWHADDARAALVTLESGVDVVLGFPPWRWQPRRFEVDTADGPLVLAEDPANVALLEACARLAPDGIGLFIVGPGFVMRPGRATAFANLKRLGLSLHLLLELPRGIFSPDSGSGRLLIGIGPAPWPAPLIGSLTPDRTAALVAAVRRSRGVETRRLEPSRHDAVPARSETNSRAEAA